MGAAGVQGVTLAAGPNLVSLHVRPDDPDLSAIFGAVASDVLFVKGAHGAVYAPDYGVGALAEWPWDQAVFVFARQALTLDVAGRHIEPASVIPLDAGWNWVPYLLSEPASPAVAFASLVPHLVSVEDGAGRAYPTPPGGLPLETLVPGFGYKVYLSSPDTLAFGAPPDPPAPHSTVPTVAAALALSGLVVGDEVSVLGFATPGDGGGGLFRVTASGCTPDGGTCFVPTDHTEEGTPASSSSSFTIPQTPVQWESLQLCHSTNPAPQDPTNVTGDGCFSAVQLHGAGSSYAAGALLNTATGRVTIKGSMSDHASRYDGTSRFTATFRFATDAVRLERVAEPLTLEGVSTTAYVRPEWWGGRPDGSDATDALGWAFEAARAYAAEAGYEHYVVLKGMYGYGSILETQDGTVLKGEVDGVRDGQGLRVMPGAPWHYWAVKGSTDAAYREPRNERDAFTVDPMVVLRHGRRSESDRVVDVEIDGNLAQNEYVFTPEYRQASGSSTYSGGSYLDRMLQDTPHWNGFAASSQHLDNIPGSRTRLENVHIHDTGGNLWLSGEPVDFGGSHDIRLGNTARNHVIYGVGMRPESSIERVEIYGFFWKGAHEVKQGTWRDVTFRNLVQPPQRYILDRLEVLVSHRNDAPNPSRFGDPSEGSYYFGETIVYDRLTFELDEAYPFQAAVYYDRGPMSIHGVTVRQSNPAGRLQLVNSRRKQSARSAFRLDNVEVESGGINRISLSGARTGHVRGLAVPDGSGNAGHSPFYWVRPLSPNEVYTLYDIEGQQTAGEAIMVDGGFGGTAGTAGADVFVQNAAFGSVYNHLMFIGADPADAGVQERYHVYFRNVSFSRFEPINNDAGRNRENWRVSYFDGVTVGSRTSEDTGTLSAAALAPGDSGGGTVDVPVGLFYVPTDPSYVLVSGPDAARLTGWTNVGTAKSPVLRFAFAGTQPVTVGWTAAVRPIPPSVVFPE